MDQFREQSIADDAPLPYAGALRMFYLFIYYFIANDVKGRESSLNYFTFLFKFPNVAGILQQTDR